MYHTRTEAFTLGTTFSRRDFICQITLRGQTINGYLVIISVTVGTVGLDDAGSARKRNAYMARHARSKQIE